MGEPADLVIALDKQRCNRQGDALETAKALFNAPLIAVGEEGLGEGEAFGGGIGDIGFPTKALPPGRNGDRVKPDPGDLVADVGRCRRAWILVSRMAGSVIWRLPRPLGGVNARIWA
jgi:hypothetical protein